ncbi:MAG: FecR family protein [Cyclobacteriaceae bacterium]|nr:FecR family protein [Cyclobacteriaceae bacterium]
MDFSENQLDKIISRNLSGSSTDKEEKKLKDWILASNENYLTYKIMEESAREGMHENSLLITEESFDKVWSETMEAKPVSRFSIGYRIIKTAVVSAASILLILMSVFTYRQLTLVTHVAVNGDHPVVIEKISPAGQKTKIFLPDGSSVWLNADSKLQYSSDFNEKYRTVWLTGEAYFDIKSDQSKPFQVKSGNIAIKAFGTSFNVNTYIGNQEIEVVLDQGDVIIENLFSSMIPGMPLKAKLNPGDRAVYSLNKSEFTVDHVNNTFDYTCWKNGILSFDHDDFETVINKLERWYGVNFTWSTQPAGDWTFTGEFNNEYLDSVLNKLVNSEGISYKIKNEKVQLVFPE